MFIRDLTKYLFQLESDILLFHFRKCLILFCLLLTKKTTMCCQADSLSHFK